MQNKYFSIRQRLRRAGLDLNPCLPPHRIENFERRHAVRLPAEYRDFLLYAGDGGAGVMSLGEVPRYLFEQGGVFKEAWADFRYVKQPFPFAESWLWEDEEAGGELENKLLAAYHGSLLLRDNGCGLFDILIVTGRERGKVWQLADVGITPEPRRDFAQWLENFVESASRSAING